MGFVRYFENDSGALTRVRVDGEPGAEAIGAGVHIAKSVSPAFGGVGRAEAGAVVGDLEADAAA